MTEFNVRYDEKLNCLCGQAKGHVDRKSVDEYLEKITQAASKYNCKFFLNDMREAEIDLSVIEMYELPGFLDAAGIDRSWKRSIIASKQLDDYRFWETISVNRGYHVKVHTDQNEAINWLVNRSLSGERG